VPRAEFTIPRVDRPPELEDFLQGPLPEAWTTDFRQRDPGDGNPVSQRTAAYLAHDDRSLYVVFVCHDDPAKVRARIARREDTDGDDAVVVYLDTFRDRERAYMFMTNPLGVQLDGILTEGQDEDLSFDAVWQSEGRLTADGYVVRIVIPFRSLRFPRAPTQTWGIALGRIIRRNSEEAYWPHLTKRVKGFVPQFNVVQGLPNISPAATCSSTHTPCSRVRASSTKMPPTSGLRVISGWEWTPSWWCATPSLSMQPSTRTSARSRPMIRR